MVRNSSTLFLYIHKLFVLCNYCNRDRFIHIHVSPSSCYRFNCPNPSFYTSIPVYPRILSNTSDDCCFDNYPSTSSWLFLIRQIPSYVRSYYLASNRPPYIRVVVVNWRRTQRPCHDVIWQYYDTIVPPYYYDTIVPPYYYYYVDRSPYQATQQTSVAGCGLLDRAAEDVVISQRWRRRSGTWGGSTWPLHSFEYLFA